MALDGHNILITIESSLLGFPVFLADDGFMRDARKLSRRFRARDSSFKALDLIMETLLCLRPGWVSFFLDRPLSKSGLLAEKIREKLSCLGLPGEARLVSSVDKKLGQGEEIVASADAYLIEKSGQLFDLSGYVIRQKGLFFFSLATHDVAYSEDR